MSEPTVSPEPEEPVDEDSNPANMNPRDTLDQEPRDPDDDPDGDPNNMNPRDLTGQ